MVRQGHDLAIHTLHRGMPTLERILWWNDLDLLATTRDKVYLVMAYRTARSIIHSYIHLRYILSLFPSLCQRGLGNLVEAGQWKGYNQGSRRRRIV